AGHITPMKTLYIISKGMNKQSDQEIRILESQNVIPRVTLLEDAISACLLDERYLSKEPPVFRRLFYRFLPVSFSQFVEALCIQHHFDVILSHSEKAGFPLALFMKYLRIDTPHILIVSRITSPNPKKSTKKIWLFKQVKDSVTRFLIWSSHQRNIAIETFGVSPEKMVLLKRGVDQNFWTPQESSPAPNMICSVGMEVRDYPTLVEALRPLDIPCHIATGASRGEIFQSVEKLYQIEDLPRTITVGAKQASELRDLYARSRFVVVSLFPTDSDNGLTTILESMAMGKTVICSKVDGQIDIIQDGVTGIYVPQGDPKALRDAIVELWNQPERCKEMGEAAQNYVRTHHNVEQFVDAIKHEIDRCEPTSSFRKSLETGQANI
ncbi:MAG: glycosyltransferase family 4 protein, partial [Balneolaceae bacterium]